ncbi:hypothetical protein BH10BDE1_BH10BDE1_22860 [soil metagenome]
MKKRFGPLTAVLIACLCGPEAFASRVSESVDREAKAPLEFRQLVYMRTIDEQGAEYADRLSAMFVYLYRQGGITFATNPLKAIQENQRTRLMLAKGIVTDAKVRTSLQEWLKLSVSTVTADFDSLGTVEAKVLSRDAFTQALLSSPNFWQRMTEISRIENFDFRPVVHREIRALQFTGNAVAWVAVGGVFGAAFRLLKVGRVAMIALSVPAIAVTGATLWDVTQNDESEAPTAASVKSKAENGQQEIDVDIQVLREHQRRLVILTKMREVKSALAQGSLSDLKRANPDLVKEVIDLKPMLESYRTKLKADQLPIKAAKDQSAIRSETANAVDFLTKTATALDR